MKPWQIDMLFLLAGIIGIIIIVATYLHLIGH